MNQDHADPISEALWAYYKGESDAELKVSSDISHPEPMAAAYFFRTIETMNEMERVAMDSCGQHVLDMGAGAGCHSLHLQSKGIHVTAMEQSKRMCDLMLEQGLTHVVNQKWEEWVPKERFDTILLLMNGLGMAGKRDNLPHFLIKLKQWLLPEGQILVDSSDISHLYLLDDGSQMIDLSGSHVGEIIYTVQFNDHKASFPWLFVTPEYLKVECRKQGLAMDILSEVDESYLARLTILS